MCEMRIPYLRKLTDLYYSHITDSSVVIDEARNWHCVTNVEMYIKIFGKRPKIICPVRNVEEIMASFVKVFERNNMEWDYEKDAVGETFEKPYLQLKDLYNSKYRDCLMLVEYNNLTDDPHKVLNSIYDFIEQPVYNHDLNSVESNKSYKQVDGIYNLAGLHEIKSGVTKSITDPSIILSNEQRCKFEELSFWQ